MNHKQTGFSLVEIAIAMVIMGLLVGSGILLGRSMIGSGHSQEIVAMATDLNIAVKNFKERYHYFPGDLPNAQDDISAIDAKCSYTPVQNTNAGNGLIDTNTEVDCVPNHLYSAGFIKGGALPIRSRFGDVKILAPSASDFPDGTLPGNPAHIIRFDNLPLDIARDVDRYMDNGDIKTGRMQGINADGTDIDTSTQDTVPFYAVPL